MINGMRWAGTFFVVAACCGCTDEDSVTFPDLDVPSDVTVVEGTSTSFLVQTLEPPDRELRVVVDVGPHGDKVSVTPGEFNLAPENTTQQLELVGLTDPDADDEGFNVFIAIDGDAPKTFVAVVLDTEINRPIPSKWAIEMAPSSKSEFDVRLTQPPSSPVNVTIGSDDIFAAVGDPSSLVFDASNYNIPQTVTVISYGDLQLGSTSLNLLSELPTSTVTISPLQ